MSTSQRHRPEHRPVASTARRGQRSQQSATQPASGSTADAVLGWTFEPIIVRSRFQKTPLAQQQEQDRQTSFFQSLTYLTDAYRLQPVSDTSHLPYPLNIGTAFSQINQQLRTIDPTVKLIVAGENESKATLAVVKEQDAEFSIYYLPIAHLYRLLRQQRHTPYTRLMLAVSSYFYWIADIPYCTEDCDSYVTSQYDWIRDLEEELSDEELECRQTYRGESARYVARIDHLSDWVRKRFSKPDRVMNDLTQAIEGLQPASDNDHHLMQLGKRVLTLYRNFPNSTFNQTRIYDYDSDEYCDGVIEFDERVSFIWSCNDFVHQMLMDNFDCEFSSGASEGPCRTSILFDTPTTPQQLETDHNYIRKLLDRMSDFADLL